MSRPARMHAVRSPSTKPTVKIVSGYGVDRRHDEKKSIVCPENSESDLMFRTSQNMAGGRMRSCPLEPRGNLRVNRSVQSSDGGKQADHLKSPNPRKAVCLPAPVYVSAPHNEPLASTALRQPATQPLRLGITAVPFIRVRSPGSGSTGNGA
jgi:hypothetical protein